MSSAGIDTKVFSAHSTRGAATSKAKSAGVSTGDILKAANWSTTSTFCRFYHRPVNSGKFGRGVLRTGASSEILVSFKRYRVVNYVVRVYPEPRKYNYRFLKDCSNLMRRMNCMRRWIHGYNIVSHPNSLPISIMNSTYCRPQYIFKENLIVSSEYY